MTTRTKKRAKPGTPAELAEMFAAPREIKVRVASEVGSGKKRRFVYGEDSVSVCALPIQQLGGLIDILAPLVAGDKAEVGFWELAAEHRDMVYAAFAHATGWPLDEIRRIHPSDFLTVAHAIVEANADFFVRLLGPAVFGLQGMPDKVPGNGAGPNPSVSFAGGDAPTPSASRSPSSTPQ